MTKKAISVWAKKNFLHWFSETQQFTNDGAKQLLLYLADSEELLAWLHIVLDGSSSRPLLVISTEGIGMPPFLLKTAQETITDWDTIIGLLHSHRNEPFYLTLYFTDRMTSEPHRAVVEEFPESGMTRQVLIDFELSLWLEEFKREFKRAELFRQIDQALDAKDKRKFRRLIKKLRTL